MNSTKDSQKSPLRPPQRAPQSPAKHPSPPRVCTPAMLLLRPCHPSTPLLRYALSLCLAPWAQVPSNPLVLHTPNAVTALLHPFVVLYAVALRTTLAPPQSCTSAVLSPQLCNPRLRNPAVH
eukprot:389329-Pelagomonas_calceolata.AAC.6